LANQLLDPARTSMDKGKVTARGTWLCDVFKDYNIFFVSGAEIFGPSGGKFTSFQGIRKTVIDYVAYSREFFSQIKLFTVADQVQGYDHAALIVNLEIDIGSSNITFESPRKKRKVDVVLPDDTELDKLFIQTLATGKDEEKKLRALRGPATTPLKVTIYGGCLNAGWISASPGSTIYWGPNPRRNMSGKVWGNQPGPRAELLAALLAIKTAPLFRSLEISTRSDYVIRGIADHAPLNAACGWMCKNAIS
jgi:hypothetical protein